MPDRLISALTALTAPAAGDYLPIVDISEGAATSKNKRITIEDTAKGIVAQPAFLQSGTSATLRSIESKLKDVVSVKDFGAVGDGTTLDTTAIKAACDYAITNGKSVYIPAGVYLCTYNVLLFTFATSTTKTFSIFGDGAASILKMGDGLITSSSRRFLDFRPSVNMDLIEVRDLVLDNNARGSTPPPSPYDYEQSHTLRFAGATGTTTKVLKYSNLLIKDPVADGMNNQGIGTIQNWVISNCSEIDRTRVRSSVQMSYFPENLVITGFTGYSIESEPVAAITTLKTITINGCSVDLLDMAGHTNPTLTVYHISNTTVKNAFLYGDCIVRMSNCDIPVTGTGRMNYPAPGSCISDTTFRHAYDSSTGAVVGINIFGVAGKEHEIAFDNCRFLINHSGTLPVAATGYLVTNSAACVAADVSNWQVTISNCYFDPRAAGSVDCYRNGTWKLVDNSYACATLTTSVAAVFHNPSNPTYASNVLIDGGDFRQVVGYGLGVSNAVATSQALGSLTLCGTCVGGAALNVTKLSGGTLAANDAYTNNSRRVLVASLPSYAINGDTVIIQAANTAIGAGIEYVATASSVTAPAFRLVRQKGIKRDTTANRPTFTSNDVGATYLDNTLDADGKPIWWNGAAWVDATGAVV
jgi:hypothetical protein